MGWFAPQIRPSTQERKINGSSRFVFLTPAFIRILRLLPLIWTWQEVSQYFLLALVFFKVICLALEVDVLSIYGSKCDNGICQVYLNQNLRPIIFSFYGQARETELIMLSGTTFSNILWGLWFFKNLPRVLHLIDDSSTYSPFWSLLSKNLRNVGKLWELIKIIWHFF